MGDDIKKYIQACEICQRFGGIKWKESLHPIQIGNAYDHIGIDLVGPLQPTRQGNQYIVVVTEYLTKWLEARAIPDK